MAGSVLEKLKPRPKGWFWFLLGGFIIGISLNLYYSWSPFLWSYDPWYSEQLFVEPENLNLDNPAQTIEVLQIYETPVRDWMKGDPFEVMEEGRLVFETRQRETIAALFLAFRIENRLGYEDAVDDSYEEALMDCNVARTEQSPEYHAIAYDRALMKISYFYFYLCRWGKDTIADIGFPVGWHDTIGVHSREFAKVVGDLLWLPYTGEVFARYPLDEDWLPFEPAVVTLQGRVTYRDYFGPPHYGENPATDAVETAVILVLCQPVNVGGTADGVVFPGIRKIQLVVPWDKFSGLEIQGKNIVATGVLFEAVTGHHRTPVLMSVQDLKMID